MVRTATRGVLGFLLVVAFVLAGLFWVPSAARAIEPPPPPIQEVLDIPSRVVKSVTGTPLGDAVMMMLRGQTWALAGGSLNTIPKPITAPQVLTRTAGAPLTAGMLGWAIGSNGGLLAVGAITGTTYDQQFCSQAPWYQGVTGFINFGVTPDCKQFAPQPNADMASTLELTYQGVTLTVVGVPFTSPPNTALTYCANRVGSVAGWPSTQTFFVQTPVNDLAYHIYGPRSAAAIDVLKGYCAPAGGSPVPAMTGTFDNLPAEISKLVVRDTNALPGMQVKATATPVKSDPLRTPKCKVKLGNEVFEALGIPYRESEGIPTSASGLGCDKAYEDFVSAPGRGPELVPDEITVESTPEGGGAPTEISKQLPPEYTPAEKTALAPTSSRRGLVLEKVINGVPDSCMTWAADCANWWVQTNSGTSSTTATGTYRCLFADQLIDLAECGIYRYTFDTRTTTPTVTDPSTGTQTPWTTGNPSGTTSGNNSTSPGSVPSPGDACFSQGWPSLANPVDWVMHPVKCAMVAVFAPSPAKVQQLVDGVDDAWANTWPRKGMESMATVLAAVPTASGCSGPHIQWSTDWPAPIDFDAYPLSACDEPIATLAWWARVLGAFMLIGYTAWGVTRRVGSVVNAPGAGPS